MPATRSRAPAAEDRADGASPTDGRRGLKAVVQALVKLAYPALILCAWRWDTPRYVGCMLFAILWLQRWAGSGPVATSLRRLSAIDWTVVGLLSCASAAIVLTNSELLLRLYPSLVNLGLLIAFGATLVRGPSMIEKFARLGKRDLPPGAVRHTRRVTQVWCGFFVLNGVFSAYTALYWSRASWLLYNGALAYLLIGVLLVAEVAWRYLVVLPRAARLEAAS
ncbi:MAG: FIG017861: hypothetical protein [uncultured Paraburkholderia sp.]|nr:MAG: FIG017861: hypothetical protein [uncultured Paraburkholderia sp.]CAH2795011.1 MAG: FIG017861: hypothetical protein [uncultured Paraburkholderia sp.]CAH2929009.1 MAG: FIG017861: hypothetical protein [uncultured Paraburkholderia sp.]CAH2930299.1 MAG: FIG017861: hypothetical protein [uncultured Paraburkholderia sp.]